MLAQKDSNLRLAAFKALWTALIQRQKRILKNLSKSESEEPF